MSKLPIVSAEDLEKLLYYMGFFRKRQKGSHVFFQHADGRATVVPFHASEDIGRGLLRKILRDIGMEPEEFINILKEIL